MTDARLRRDVVWNLIPVLLLGVVGLGMNFVIGYVWGASGLGVFNQVTTAFFVVSVLGAGGLQYSVLRAVAEIADEVATDRDQVAATVVGALVPAVVIASVSTVVFVAVAPAVGDLLDSGGVAIGMRWAAPGLFCFAVNKVLLGVVNGRRRMRAFAVYQSARYVLMGVGLGVCIARDLPPAALWTIAEAALLVILLPELPLRGCRGWTRHVGMHVGYGARGVAATLAYELNSKLDVWCLGVVMSDAVVGVYSLASVLAEGAMQIAVAVQNNLNPLLAKALATGDHAGAHALVERTRRWFVPALVGLCVVSAVAYPFVIPVLTGDGSFAAGAPAYAILVAGIALASPWLPFNQVLLMASRPGWHTVFVLLGAGLNLVGNLLLIPRIGMQGAATATAVTLVLSVILLVRIAKTRAGVRL